MSTNQTEEPREKDVPKKYSSILNICEVNNKQLIILAWKNGSESFELQARVGISLKKFKFIATDFRKKYHRSIVIACIVFFFSTNNFLGKIKKNISLPQIFPGVNSFLPYSFSPAPIKNGELIRRGGDKFIKIVFSSSCTSDAP